MGGGNFQDDAGMAVSIVNVTVMTVRVLRLIASETGLFVIGVYEQTAPLHASLYGQEDDCVRPPLLLSQLDVNEKKALLDIEKTLHGYPSAPRLWKLTRDAVFAALEMHHKEQENILRQLCAELALWIFVWFGAKTSL